VPVARDSEIPVSLLPSANTAIGFSLIELLVVLLIVGLGMSMLRVSFSGSDGYQLRVEAKQFANGTALMAEEAVMANRQWGVDIYRFQDEDSPSADPERFGYRWLVRNEQGLWLPGNDNIRQNEFSFGPGIGLLLELDRSGQEHDIEFKQRVIDPDSQINADLAEGDSLQQEPLIPELWLLSSGEMTEFSLQLFDRENPDMRAHIRGDVLGRVSLDPQDNADAL